MEKNNCVLIVTPQASVWAMSSAFPRAWATLRLWRSDHLTFAPAAKLPSRRFELFSTVWKCEHSNDCKIQLIQIASVENTSPWNAYDSSWTRQQAQNNVMARTMMPSRYPIVASTPQGFKRRSQQLMTEAQVRNYSQNSITLNLIKKSPPSVSPARRATIPQAFTAQILLTQRFCQLAVESSRLSSASIFDHLPAARSTDQNRVLSKRELSRCRSQGSHSRWTRCNCRRVRRVHTNSHQNSTATNDERKTQSIDNISRNGPTSDF